MNHKLTIGGGKTFCGKKICSLTKGLYHWQYVDCPECIVLKGKYEANIAASELALPKSNVSVGYPNYREYVQLNRERKILTVRNAEDYDLEKFSRYFHQRYGKDRHDGV